MKTHVFHHHPFIPTENYHPTINTLVKSIFLMIFCFIIPDYLYATADDPCNCTSFTSLGANDTETTITTAPPNCTRIRGTIIINNNITLSNLSLRMDTKAELRINSNVVIEDCFISTCGNVMWKGINVVEGKSLVLTGNVIKNAEFGVLFTGNATFTCTTNSFRENWVGLSAGRPYESPLNGVIINTLIPVIDNEFTCSSTLPDPYTGHPEYPSGWSSSSAIPYNKSLAALYVSGAEITFGALGLSGGEKNVISDHRNAFLVNNGTANIQGNIINNLVGEISRTQDVLLKNQYGMFAYNSTVLVEQNQFSDLKTGIVAEETGITANRNTITIDPQPAEEGRTLGIEVMTQDYCVITSNEIYDASYGIHLYYGSSPIDVSLNIIQNDFEDSGAAGIFLEVWKSPDLNMKENEITLTSQIKATGIKLMISSLMTVQDNTIRFINEEDDGESNTGISMEEIHTSYFDHNTITGTLEEMVTDNAGWRMNVTGINTLFCNPISGFNSDMVISAMNPGNKLITNEFGDADCGLVLRTPTYLGEQEHFGNIWIGSYDSGFGAFIDGNNELSTAQRSRFRVDPSDGPSGTILPVYGPSSVSNEWFISESGATKICETPPPSPAPIAGDLADLVTEDIDFEDFESEMTWLAKAHVFKQILDHSSLLSNATLDSFYNAEYLTDFGLLLALEHRLHSSSFLETYDRTDLVLSIHAMMDSISQIDSILTTSPVNVQDYRDDRILVAAELADSMVVWLGIMESERTERISTLEEILEELDEISTSIHIEDAFQTSLIGYVKTRLQNSLSSGELDTLLDIASQCLWEAGLAVFYAQSVYSFLKDTSFASNPFSCAEPLPLISGLNSYEHHDLKAWPNPGGGLYQYEYNENIGTFILSDITGRIIKSGNVHQGPNELNLTDVPPGLYYLTVTGQSRKLRSIKIIHQ